MLFIHVNHDKPDLKKKKLLSDSLFSILLYLILLYQSTDSPYTVYTERAMQIWCGLVSASAGQQEAGHEPMNIRGPSI